MTNVKSPFCLRRKRPCGSTRKCRDHTVTHVTSVQVKMSHQPARQHEALLLPTRISSLRLQPSIPPTSCHVLQCAREPSYPSSLICIQDSSCCSRVSAHRISCCTTCCSVHLRLPPPRPEGLVRAPATGLPCLCHPGFGFHGVPFNVVRNSKSQRSNSGRLRTFLVLYTPLGVKICGLEYR